VSESTLTVEAEPTTVPAEIQDVRDTPLGRLAQQGAGDGLGRVLPGYDGERVSVAAFQSSI
jgi:hypothetical protein